VVTSFAFDLPFEFWCALGGFDFSLPSVASFAFPVLRGWAKVLHRGLSFNGAVGSISGLGSLGGVEPRASKSGAGKGWVSVAETDAERRWGVDVPAGSSGMPGCSGKTWPERLRAWSGPRGGEGESRAIGVFLSWEARASGGGEGRALFVLRGGEMRRGVVAPIAAAEFSLSSVLVRGLRVIMERWFWRESLRGLLFAGMLDMRSGITGGCCEVLGSAK
jgi:hypothetical protein